MGHRRGSVFNRLKFMCCFQGISLWLCDLWRGRRNPGRPDRNKAANVAKTRLNQARMLRLYPRKTLDEVMAPPEGPVPLQADSIVAEVTADGTTPLFFSGRVLIAGLLSHPAHNTSVMTLQVAKLLNLEALMTRRQEGSLPPGMKEEEAVHIVGFVAQVPVQWQMLETEIDFYVTREPMSPEVSIGLEVLLNNGLCQYFSQDAPEEGESYITLPHPSVDSATSIAKERNPEIVAEASFFKSDLRSYGAKIAVTGRPENVILKSFLKENRVCKTCCCFAEVSARPKGLALVMTFDTITVRVPVFKRTSPCIKNEDVSFALGTNFLARNGSVIDYGRRILFLRDNSGGFVPLKLQVLPAPSGN